jgi:hypothetical protein
VVTAFIDEVSPPPPIPHIPLQQYPDMGHAGPGREEVWLPPKS